jgi:polyhydroxyalkanoate synthesis repressor PhaR
MARAVEREAGEPTEAQTVSITRYPNRRLYDRTRARYITLQEIADLVRQGKTVTVRESKTGEDVTRSVLTQIILEHHPERMNLFPIDVLNSMIRANETTLGLLRDYFLQSLAYLKGLQQPSPFNPLAFPMAWMRTLLPNVPPTGTPATSRSAVDAEALAARVAELERRLEEVQAGKTTRPSTRRGKTSS